MWRQFTENGRRALHFAQMKAKEKGYTRILPEHLGWGLLIDNNTTAGRTLRSLGVSPETICEETARLAHRGPGGIVWELKLAPASSRIIDLAYDEARQLGNKHIGTEHLLLALIRDRNNPTAHILARFGIRSSAARAVVREIQQGGRLLRPASDPALASHMLVRPVAGHIEPETDSRHLLRSAALEE